MSVARPVESGTTVPFNKRDSSEKKLIEQYNKKMTPEEWKKEYTTKKEPHYAEEGQLPSPLASELVKDLSKLGIRQGKILEIGSGIGRDTAFMAEKGHIVKGIDIIEKAVRNAQKVYGAVKGATFEVGDAQNLRFQAESFDAVYSIAALHATPIRFTFREINRVLKPGGIAKLFLYTRTKTGDKWVSYWTPGEIKQYAKEEGFTIKRFREGHDTESIEIPGVKNKVEQETHLVITTLRKPEAAKPK